MGRKRAKKNYGLFGLFWRLLVAGTVVFALAGGGSYLLAERLIHRPEAEAPNLLTLELEEALVEASEAGFAVQIGDREASGLVDEGHVLSQRPSPGMSIKKGSTIRVTIATGP